MEKKPAVSKDWVVRFLNLPSHEQVDFLFRYVLEEELRKELERKVFNDES